MLNRVQIIGIESEKYFIEFIHCILFIQSTENAYSLEIQVCVRQYAVNGGSGILASDWPSQFSFDQWPSGKPFQCESGKD